MKSFESKVGFVTGAASGIGLAMARAFHARGMRVVMTDSNGALLNEVAGSIGDPGRILPLQLDVTDRVGFAAARERVMAHFGGLNLLCNNAGIGSMPSIESSSFADWDWTMGVNVGGVINGVVTFLPVLQEADDWAHIVNTASIAGIVPLGGGASVYSVSKQAVRALSEELRGALAGKRIGVSVLCPGYVSTPFSHGEERRPARYAGGPAPTAQDVKLFEQLLTTYGMAPEEVAEHVVHGIESNKAYIFTHPEVRAMIGQYHAHILADLPDEQVTDPNRLEGLALLESEWLKLKV